MRTRDLSGLLIVAILIGILPVYAQDQQPDAAKLKVDAQKVVSTIGGDDVKLRVYCRINSLSNSMLNAVQEQNNEKAERLFQRIDELEQQLGPEYHALFNSLYDADPNSEDTQEIFSMFDKLEDSCPH
jgi:glutathionyl-hydroquinone reductase